jgi:hypothetical protein
VGESKSAERSRSISIFPYSVSKLMGVLDDIASVIRRGLDFRNEAEFVTRKSPVADTHNKRHGAEQQYYRVSLVGAVGTKTIMFARHLVRSSRLLHRRKR